MSGDLPSFEDTTLEVSNISATEGSTPKVGAGLTKLKMESVSEPWSIPIDHKNMKNFEPINFKQENNQELVIKQATADPTTFVVKIDEDKLKELPDFTGPDTYQLIIKDKEREKNIPYNID